MHRADPALCLVVLPAYHRHNLLQLVHHGQRHLVRAHRLSTCLRANIMLFLKDTLQLINNIMLVLKDMPWLINTTMLFIKDRPQLNKHMPMLLQPLGLPMTLTDRIYRR